MNEADVTRAMADALVERGALTREQADQGMAADLAAAQAKAPSFGSGTAAPGDAGIRQRAAELVASGAMTQAEADMALSAY